MVFLRQEKNRRLWAAVLFLVFGMIISNGIPLTAKADTLGISVSVEPTEQSNSAGLRNDSVWFALEPGESMSRTVSVQSYSDLDQEIEFELYDYQYIDNSRSIALDSESSTVEWFSVEEVDLVVPSRETRQFTLTYSIPTDAEERSYEGVLRVAATSAEAPTEESAQSSGTRAVVGGRMAIDVPFWVGIGDALNLLPNFEINSIEGLLIEGRPVLEVEIENTGPVPLFLQGTVQFADPVFADRVFDPVDFRLNTVPSDGTGLTRVELNPEITDGDWRVLVTAAQGEVRKTRLFETELVFRDPNAVPDWWPAVQIALVVIFGAVAAVSLRALRKSRRQKSDDDPQPPTMPRMAPVEPPTPTKPGMLVQLANSVSDLSTLAREKSKELRTRVQKQQDQSREKTILRLKKRLKRLEDKQFDRKMEAMKLSTTFPSSMSADSFGVSSSWQETGYSKTDEIFSSMVEEMATVGASTEPTEKPSSSSSERQPARETVKKATTSTRAQAKPAARTSSTKKPSQPASKKASDTTTKKTATKAGSQAKASTKTTAAKKPQAKSTTAKKPASGASKSTSTRSTGSRTKKS